MQFGEKRYKNRGVYAVLKPPNFESPSFHSFKTLERPQVWSGQFITILVFFFPVSLERNGANMDMRLILENIKITLIFSVTS